MRMTENELKQIIKDTAQVDLKANDVLYDFGIDSLVFMDILLQAEEKTGIRIPDDEIANLKTIAQILVYINSK